MTQLTHEVKVADAKNTTTFHLVSGRKATASRWTKVPLTDLAHPYIERLIEDGVLETREIEVDLLSGKKIAAAKPAAKSKSKAKSKAEPVAEIPVDMPQEAEPIAEAAAEVTPITVVEADE